MNWLTQLVDTIIPPSEVPGASQTGVPEYIVRALRTLPAAQERFRHCAGCLDEVARQRFGTGFVALMPEQRYALLLPISQEPDSPLGRFFLKLRDWTLEGYYQRRDAEAATSRWSADSPRPEFPGCTP